MAIYLQNVVAGTWTNFGEIIAPLAFSKTLKDNIASCTVNIFFESTAVSTALLMPGTIVRLADGATAIDYFVVEDASKSDSSSVDPFSIHTYKLSELLAITREVYVQTSFFSNGDYTFDQFFTRLFALSKCDYTLSVYPFDDYYVALANWKSPDYQVASNSLLDNLFKIGKMLGVRFKAVLIPNTNTIYLVCMNLLGTGTAATLGTSKNGSLSQYMASNYAAKVVANVENMTGDQEHWIPEDDSIFGMVAEPDNNASKLASLDNLVLILPHPIRSASELRAIGFIDSMNFNSYTIYDKNDAITLCDSSATYAAFIASLRRETPITTFYRNETGVPVSFKIYEYAEWMLLDPDAAYNGAEYHQENTLYYKRGENKIYNLKICAGETGIDTDYPAQPIYYQNYNGDHVGVFQTLSPCYNYYSVKCDLYVDGQIIEKNELNGERAALYVQSENLVSGRTLIGNMRDYINSMTNADETEVFETDTLAGCAALGAVYNSKVIHTINYEVVYNSVKVQYELSDDVVPKSEYVSADGGLMLPDITTSKVYDRFTNYSSTLWFCRTQAEATAIRTQIGGDSYLKADFITNALNALVNGRTNKGIIPAEILMRTGEYESDNVYSALCISVRAIWNSLIISWRTRDNLAVGAFFDDADSESISDYVYLPIAFINENGVSKYVTYKVLSDSVHTSEENFPSISGTTFSSSTPIIEIDDENYYHDSAERINGIFQANFKTYLKSDKIYQTYLEEMGLLNDLLNHTDFYTRFVKIGSTNYEIVSVSVTTPVTDIRKVSVVYSGSETVGNAYACTFLRIKDGTSVEEKMLEITCTIADGGGGNKAAVFYVAFTK